MSLETWKEEFFPHDPVAVSKLDNLAQLTLAVRKWTGLLPHNLAKHNGYQTRKDIYFPPSSALSIDSNTCSLCHAYMDDEDCEYCPLTELRYGVNCSDTPFRIPYEYSPYPMFIRYKTPIPMLVCLQQALIQARKQEMASRKHTEFSLQLLLSNPHIVDVVGGL